MRLVHLFLALFCAYTSVEAEAPPLQQWIDEAIKAGGGVVTIPEGEHVLTASLILKDAKKLALRGVNKERCILRLAPNSDDRQALNLIHITGASETVEIANLTLEGNAHTKTLVFVDGMKAPAETRPRDVVVRDSLMQNFHDAVLVQNSTACSIERCSLRDGFRAICFSSSSTKGSALGNKITRVSNGFQIQDSTACLIEGNEVWSCDHGVTITGKTTDSQEESHRIRNNGFSKTRVGLHLAGGAQTPLLEGNENLLKSDL